MLKLGICFQCDIYTDLRTVQLEDGTWGYKCPLNHVQTRSGKPAKEKGTDDNDNERSES